MSTIDGFWAFINERHRIYLKKEAGDPWPWTDDPILRKYKFTNVFRELDAGTIALREMIDSKSLELIAWNIMWYRSFNLADHASIGFQLNPYVLSQHIMDCKAEGKKIFTSAHLTAGRKPKHVSMLGAVRVMYENRYGIVNECMYGSMQRVFNYLKQFPSVGNFISYEMVCDFRFYPLLEDATDINTWTNIGQGSARGLKRLGMMQNVDSAVGLLKDARLEQHFDGMLFELREIEHSLCEFDKYERARLGEGVPKQLYRRK